MVSKNPVVSSKKNVIARGTSKADTAETRATHIAKCIAECAEAVEVAPCDLTWFDFRAYADVAYGSNSLGIIRRDISRLGGYNAIRDAHFPPEVTQYAGVKKRVREHANINRRLGHQDVEDAFQFKKLEEFAKRVFSGKIVPYVPPVAAKGAPTAKGKTPGLFNRELVVCIGDTHFGSDISGVETGAQSYGKVQEARRMAEVVKQVIEYKPEHRHNTALNVVLLGDMIHGCLHDLRDGAVLSEQQSRAIHLLIQAIAHFSAAFPKVRIYCVTGNHGRDQRRHLKKATAGKADSRETLIYSASKMATRLLTNVEWHIPLSQFAVMKLFGKKYFITHGDGVIKVGNPGQSINSREIERQVDKLNATLRDKDEYVAVIVGHVHKATTISLDNGVEAIINGAMTPVDPFAVSIGIYESVANQVMFEVVEGHPVGDLRKISLDIRVDTNAAHDKIIHPWSEF